MVAKGDDDVPDFKTPAVSLLKDRSAEHRNVPKSEIERDIAITLAVKTDKTKKRLGTYYSGKKRIIVHVGWSSKYDMVDTAIPEYEHHIHYTEFDKAKKKQAPHGKEFWQIYGQLMNKARIMGICNGSRATVIDFPGDAKPTSFFVEEIAEVINETPENATEINEDTTPDFRRVMKDLLRCWNIGLTGSLPIMLC